MKRTKNNKVYVINVNSIIYAIIFLALLVSAIYFMSKGMGDTNVIMQPIGVYDKDQSMAIEAVANNVTGRINNIIAISAIFFAIIVSSVSVFQFIKVKDFDRVINDSLKRTQDLKEEVAESRLQLDNLNNDLKRIGTEKDKLKLENIKTRLELNIYKINEDFFKAGSRLDKVIKLIDESINLIIEYPNIIDNIEVSKLYHKRAYVQYRFGDYESAMKLGNIALNKVKEKYSDMDIDDIEERIYVEGLGRLLLDIQLEYQDYEAVEMIIKEMGQVLVDEIEDRVVCLVGSKVEEAIDIIKENKKYYGEYFLKIFRERYYEGMFDEFNKDSDFKKLMKDIGLQI